MAAGRRASQVSVEPTPRNYDTEAWRDDLDLLAKETAAREAARREQERALRKSVLEAEETDNAEQVRASRASGALLCLALFTVVFTHMVVVSVRPQTLDLAPSRLTTPGIVGSLEAKPVIVKRNPQSRRRSRMRRVDMATKRTRAMLQAAQRDKREKEGVWRKQQELEKAIAAAKGAKGGRRGNMPTTSSMQRIPEGESSDVVSEEGMLETAEGPQGGDEDSQAPQLPRAASQAVMGAHKLKVGMSMNAMVVTKQANDVPSRSDDGDGDGAGNTTAAAPPEVPELMDLEIPGIVTLEYVDTDSDSNSSARSSPRSVSEALAEAPSAMKLLGAVKAFHGIDNEVEEPESFVRTLHGTSVGTEACL